MRPFFVLLALLFSVSICHARQKEKPPLINPVDQELIGVLSHQPELMNIEYLQYVIGRPDNEVTQRAKLSKHYIWHAPNGQPEYELFQREQWHGQVVEASFLVHMDEGTATLDDIEKIYGIPARRLFDYKSHATQLYSFAPNTYVAFSCPKDSFRAQKAKVLYNGPVLARPSDNDMEAARAALMTRAQALVEKGDLASAIPLLQVRLKDRPEDGEAHYQLAMAYARVGRVQDAIGHYKAGLAIAQATSVPAPGYSGSPSGATAAPPASGPEDLKKRCIVGLTELKVLDDPTKAEEHSEKPARRFEAIHHGQHLRAAGPESRKKKDKDKAGKNDGGAAASN